MINRDECNKKREKEQKRETVKEAKGRSRDIGIEERT